ncbi:MAG: TIGR03435 family protein, partial [Acidobacteriia bacterium]|nr:TIGR03435 family protein [Terriglobia bacterium]
TDCEAVLAAVQGRGGGPPPPPGGPVLPCTVRTGNGTFSANGRSPAQLAGILSAYVERRVVDQTGLTGLFDAELTWTPDQIQRLPGTDDPAAIDPDAPSILTAVQEQLGLRLRPAKGPVEVLVIDSVQRPTPN